MGENRRDIFKISVIVETFLIVVLMEVGFREPISSGQTEVILSIFNGKYASFVTKYRYHF